MTDPDLDPLRSLPPRDADPPLASRTRASALAAFQQAHGDYPWAHRLTTLWSRVVLPVALAAFVGVYLTKVIDAASALYG